ncbi:hypothetical protein [Nonomuraea aurantiaca]|uniref:hypothetical protein n=1 Tax=Nonomuraea aurantiaca TaxID=2878562 RepID=UPI001CD9473B|nr:hypothetical protein [Nonomuraea aurantiaca]
MRRNQVMWMVCRENVLTVLPILALALIAVTAVAAVNTLTVGAGAAVALWFIPLGWLAPLGAGALAVRRRSSRTACSAACRSLRRDSSVRRRTI